MKIQDTILFYLRHYKNGKYSWIYWKIPSKLLCFLGLHYKIIYDMYYDVCAICGKKTIK